METAKPYIVQNVAEDGLVGELVYPKNNGSFPAVMYIGGASGGVSTEHSYLLAQAGFAVLSIGYFGLPGLPPKLANIPLEYFEKAINWLLRQPMVNSKKTAVIGSSRGSEAALQLATLSTKISALIGYVPSGIRWNGVDGLAPWTYGGKPLPYAQRLTRYGRNDSGDGGGITKVDMFNRVLDNPGMYEKAVIMVEDASCPILLYSGKDDKLWPSERMSNLIIERLNNNAYPYEFRHISYNGAGHRIKVPGLDKSKYVPVSEAGVTNELLQYGGTLEGNKRASEKSWQQTISFLTNNIC